MAEKPVIKEYNRAMLICVALSVIGIALIFGSQYIGNSIIALAAGIFICIYAFIKFQMDMKKYRAIMWLKIEERDKKEEELHKEIFKSREQ